MDPTSIQAWEEEEELVLEFYRRSKKVFWCGDANEDEVVLFGNEEEIEASWQGTCGGPTVR